MVPYLYFGGIVMLKKLLVSVATVSVLFAGNAFLPGSSAHFKNHLVPKVVKAVGQTGISAAQTKKIADGIVEYRATMSKIKGMKIFPIDSFMNDDFDEKRFIQEKSEKYMARIAAEAALFKYVFAVLNKEQGKAFKNAYAAPVIERMIKLHY